MPIAQPRARPPQDDGRIILAVMPSTSPASASASYESKRELWEELCLAPGLADWKAQLKKKKTVGSRAGRPAAVAASGGLAEWVTPSGKIAGGSEAKVTKLGRDLPDESKPKMKLKPKVAEKMPPPPPPPGTTSSGKAKPVRFQDMLDQESSRFDPTHTPGLPFLFGSGALSGSMREDLGDAYLKEGNAYQSGFKGERGFEGAALDLPMGVDSLAPPPPPAPPAPESEEDKKEAEERWVRRMLSADVSFEGVEGTCGLALGVESQTWLEEWQDDFEEWWIATPYHDGLAACFGALSIHLAQASRARESSARVERANRARESSTQVSHTAPILPIRHAPCARLFPPLTTHTHAHLTCSQLLLVRSASRTPFRPSAAAPPGPIRT